MRNVAPVLVVVAIGLVAHAEPASSGAPDTAKVFGDIYRHAKWGTNTSGIGNSGTGSTLSATLLYRTFLQQFLKDNAIHSVVDAGCGDWEFSQAINWAGIDYKGFDIVEAVVAQDTKKYARSNVHFFTANVVDQDLPAADLLISKHVLQHLPNRDVAKFLTKLSKYKHVLLINGVNRDTMSANNVDIAPGEYRELDVTRPPFHIAGAKVLTYWDGFHMQQVIYVAGAKP